MICKFIFDKKLILSYLYNAKNLIYQIDNAEFILVSILYFSIENTCREILKV